MFQVNYCNEKDRVSDAALPENPRSFPQRNCTYSICLLLLSNDNRLPAVVYKSSGKNLLL